MRIGRPRTCDCGTCNRCKRRDYMRQWYQSKTPEERRAIVARRDPELVKANDTARYRRHRGQRLAKAAAWKACHPDAVAEYQRRDRERHPDRYRARNAVANAIRDGRLVRKPCEVCASLDVHGHHDDYAKPLDVRWLCPEHHLEFHEQQKAAAA